MKRITITQVGGHTDCTEGYNFRNYKPHLPRIISQVREQVHSQLEKLTSSLRQCSFQSYMILLRTLFAFNNMKKKEII